jgi:GTP pyrophosphokinase
MEYGATEEEAIGALLHDAVEDGGGLPELDRIRERFGDGVAQIVDGCTDAYKKRKPEWKKRKKVYIARLRKEPESVCLVSASDKLYNARSILKDYRRVGEKVWKRFKGNRKDELWYYRGLVMAFRDTGFHRRLIDELDRVVTELERLSGEAS